MPKRKKYARLPNRFGSIRYLGKGRSLPFAVHPPATERDEKGFYVRPAALCYVPDWYTGFAVLTAYHAGTYTPGMELDLVQGTRQPDQDLDRFCRRIMRDFSLISGVQPQGATLAEVFDQMMAFKFGENAVRELSASSEAAYRAGFAYLEPLHDRPISAVTLDDLQECVNDCSKGKSTRANIVKAAKQIYKYALPRHICEEDASRFLIVPAGRESVHGVPFTNEEIRMLMARADDPVAASLVIMCYTGFRITAYQKMTITESYMQGGVKTAAGKDRIVPIHPGIRQLLPLPGVLLMDPHAFRKKMDSLLGEMGLSGDPKHTPHDCRHTFSRLCEAYGVRDVDRKRMMGHSLGSDITNDIYGHRTIEELAEQIAKIPSPMDL